MAFDRSVSSPAMKYWTNFARNGNPNGAGLANWPPYGAASGWQVMYFASHIGAEPDRARDREVALLEHAAD